MYSLDSRQRLSRRQVHAAAAAVAELEYQKPSLHGLGWQGGMTEMKRHLKGQRRGRPYHGARSSRYLQLTRGGNQSATAKGFSSRRHGCVSTPPSLSATPLLPYHTNAHKYLICNACLTTQNDWKEYELALQQAELRTPTQEDKHAAPLPARSPRTRP